MFLILNKRIFLVCTFITLTLEGATRRDFKCKIATCADSFSVVSLFKKATKEDKDKIVILPDPFLQASVETATKKERLFVAYKSNEIIGTKKLFIVDELSEQNNIIYNELRARSYKIPQAACFIYDGGDFTDPAYRKKGINTQLTEFSFNHILEQLKKTAQARTKLVLLYGLTDANVGNKQNWTNSGRTKILKDEFEKFAKQFYECNTVNLFIYRYPAFMPKFEITNNGKDLTPLADQDCVPGYGYILEATPQQLS